MRHESPHTVTASQMQRVCLALVLSTLCGCGLPHRADVAESLAEIDEARLQAHVEALCAIGPRPMEDSAATERTVTWLRDAIEDLGLTVEEEAVPVPRASGQLTATVRRADADPDSDDEEIKLPRYFSSYGSRVLSGLSQTLRADGWDVLGYAMTGATNATVPTTVPNLLVEIPGTSDRPGLIEISAHYDTVPGCPGADDNSSGVAAVLEIARWLQSHPPERTVRLCFFAGEEQGLLGSEVHVANMLARGDEVVGLLNLDAVGMATDAPDSQLAPIRILFVTWMPSTGDFITVIGDWNSGPLGNLLEAAIETYTPDLPYYSANRIGGMFDDAYRSDHAHYWRAGIPAIFITDTGEMRWDTYHKPGDVPAALDFGFLRRVAQATAAAALELARQ